MSERPRTARLAAVLVPLLLPWPGQPAQDAAVRTLVDRVAEAYGGPQRLSDVASLRLEGTVTAHSRREEGTFSRTVTAPGALEVRLEYPSATEIRLLRAWKGFQGSDPAMMKTVEGPLLGAMQLQGARASIPWIVVGLADRLRIVARRAHEVVLEGDLSPGLTLRFFVNRETNRIVRSESEVHVGDAVIPFSTDYADFRFVDGVLVAHLEETHASGVHTATMRIERATVTRPTPPAARPRPRARPRSAPGGAPAPSPGDRGWRR